MNKTTSNPQSKIKNTLNGAMYLTMAISLIIVSVFAFAGNSGCTSVQITSKHQVVDKYFYTFSDGNGAWSDQDFSLNEQVCVPNTDSTLAQK